MFKREIVLALCCGISLALCGCSRQQSDWQKTRETNTVDAYEQFLKKYPSGEFTAQAQARAKELYEEHDWQKARDADTADAYQAFIKQYPEGKWTEEARIRVENFTLAQTPTSPSAAPAGAAAESAMQAPSNAAAAATAATSAAAAATTAAGAGAETPPAQSASTSAAPVMKHSHVAQAATAGSPAPKAARMPAGAYRVQLGAFKSGAGAARQHWADLKQEYPKLLGGLSSKVIPKKTPDGNLYRLLASGLSEKHARHVCSVLKAKSEPCLVVPPSKG
jgi:hypothetical protein